MGSPFEREQSEKVSNKVISEQRPGGSGAGGGKPYSTLEAVHSTTKAKVLRYISDDFKKQQKGHRARAE